MVKFLNEILIFLKKIIIFLKHFTGEKTVFGKFSWNQTNVWRCARSTRAIVGFDVVVLLREGTVLSSSVMSKRSKATDYPLS